MIGVPPNRTGAHYERELVNRLLSAGYGALRLPASGSATTTDLPDVLGGGPIHLPGYGIPGDDYRDTDFHTFSRLMAVELKSGKATTLYATKDEVDALERFTATWGATPYLAARSTQQATPTSHYLVRPMDARRTDAGAYGLPIAELTDRANIIIDDDEVTRV